MKKIRIACIIAGTALLMSAWGCSQAGEVNETRTESQDLSRQTDSVLGNNSPETVRSFRITVPWGETPNGMGLHLPAGEGAIEGPSDLKPLPGDSVLILDRFNNRVVRVFPSGELLTVSSAPQDALHLETGPDKVIGLYSRLRSTIFFYDENGLPAGELKIPRRIREIRGFSIGTSRSVTVHTAFQSRYELGNPESPIPTHAVLQTPQEGIFPDAAGAGLAVILNNEGFSLLEIEPRCSDATSPAGLPNNRRTMERSHTVWTANEDVSSVRLVGRADEIVCMRIENLHNNGYETDRRVTVEREVICIHIPTESILFRKLLKPVGKYVPGRDLALGTQPMRLVHIEPSREGLVIHSWAINPQPDLGDVSDRGVQ